MVCNCKSKISLLSRNVRYQIKLVHIFLIKTLEFSENILSLQNVWNKIIKKKNFEKKEHRLQMIITSLF